MSDLVAYASQSAFTDPGDLAGRLDTVPGDLTSLQWAARRLVFHYRGDGDFAENNIAADRIAEIDTWTSLEPEAGRILCTTCFRILRR